MRSVIAMMGLVWLLLGILGLAYEWRQKEKIWEIENGILKCPGAEIDLGRLKRVERNSYNEETFYDLKLTEGTAVRIKSPCMPSAERNLISLLRKAAEKNGKMVDGVAQGEVRSRTGY